MSTATEKQEIATVDEMAYPAAKEIAPVSAGNIFFDKGNFEQLQRVAKMFAESTLVPDAFRGNLANCSIMLERAWRGVPDEHGNRQPIDPFMLMQNSYVVHGRPGIEAKLAIAFANASGAFSGRIQYTYAGEGNSRQCTAYAIDRRSGDRVEAVCSIEMAKAEGWLSKSGSKWKTLPDLMLAYRSASFLIKLHCPEVLMGMSTVDELHDSAPVVMPAASRLVEPGDVSAADLVAPQAAEAATEVDPSEAPNVPENDDYGEESQEQPEPATETAEPDPRIFEGLKQQIENAKTGEQFDAVGNEIDFSESAGDISKKQKTELRKLLKAKRG